LVVDEFINEGSAALMSPEDDEEELWADLLSDVGAVCNNFVLWLLDNLADATEDTSKITDVERVVELGWGWQESSSDCVPDADGSINEEWSHVDNIGGVFLWVEEMLKDSTIDVLNRSLGWRSHVDVEEVSLESWWDIITATTWMVHSSKILQVLDGLEETNLILA